VRNVSGMAHMRTLASSTRARLATGHHTRAAYFAAGSYEGCV
jgi:hypothetical protein